MLFSLCSKELSNFTLSIPELETDSSTSDEDGEASCNGKAEDMDVLSDIDSSLLLSSPALAPSPSLGSLTDPDAHRESSILLTVSSPSASRTSPSDTSEQQHSLLKDESVTEQDLTRVGGLVQNSDQVVEANEDDTEQATEHTKVQDCASEGLLEEEEESCTELVHDPDTHHPHPTQQQVTPSTHSTHLSSCRLTPVVVQSAITGKEGPSIFWP